MGTCLGRCFKSKYARKYEQCQTSYFCNRDIVEFDHLVEKEASLSSGFSLTHSLSSFFSLRKKKVSESKISVELINDSWPFHFRDEPVVHNCLQTHLPLHHLEPVIGGSHRSSLDFHTLDPRDLMVSRPRISKELTVLHSTSPSSVDLEWEHEDSFYSLRHQDEENDSDCLTSSAGCSGGPQQVVYQLIRAQHHKQSSITNDSSSASKDASRITTPDSLEWDFVDTSMPNIDRETEQLIAEIEQLASRALEETGDYLLQFPENSHENVH